MRLRTAAVPTVLAAMLLLAACGSDGSTNNGAAGNRNGQGFGGGMQTALADYVSCMKDNGVTLTLPSGGPGGAFGGNGGTPSSGTPSGAPPSGLPEGGSPPSGGARPSGAPGGGGFGNFLQKPDDVSQQIWDAATKACSSKLPSFGGRPSGDAAAPQPSLS